MADSLEAMIRAIVREEIAASRAPASTTPYLSTEEAAAYAKVDPGTVRRWIREGKLTRYEAGRELRVSTAELEKQMKPGARSRRRALSPEDLAARDFG